MRVLSVMRDYFKVLYEYVCLFIVIYRLKQRLEQIEKGLQRAIHLLCPLQDETIF